MSYIFIIVTLMGFCHHANGITLKPFMPLAHAVQSDPIEVIDNYTLFIPKFYYDGLAPNAYFWVGEGEPSVNGTMILDENNSKKSLSFYSGKNITLHLPKNITETMYLAVWSPSLQQSFGHVHMSEILLENESNRIRMSDFILGVELTPFQNTSTDLRSGPIVLIDERTFYIPFLSYNGNCTNAVFWAGKGNQPSSSGFVVSNINGSNKPLTKHSEQNIYIRLPKNFTVLNIDYLSIWCRDKAYNIGNITINSSLTIPPSRTNIETTDSGSKILRIPKCCPRGQMVDKPSCIESGLPFEPYVDIHMNNITHMNTDPLSKSRIVYAPYIYKPSCEKFALVPDLDNYSLLLSGQLLYLSRQDIVSHGDYCLDTVNLDGLEITTAFVCINIEAPMNMASVLIIVIYFSIMALIVVCTLHCMIEKIRRYAYGKCIIGYVLTLAMSFILLTMSYYVADQNVCTVLGFLFQWFSISSFTWFTTMCYGTYNRAKNHDNDSITTGKNKRFIISLSLSTILPTLIIFVSICMNWEPGMPNSYLGSMCVFETYNNKHLIYSIPVISLILVSIGFLTSVGFIIRKNGDNILYPAERREINNRLRCGIFLTIAMIIYWANEFIFHYFMKSVQILDVFHSVLGILVAATILYIQPTRDYIRNYFKKYSCKSTVPPTNNSHVSCNRNGEIHELRPLTN